MQLETLTKKLEDKIIEASNYMMQIKQLEMDKQLFEEQSKHRVENLNNKISDGVR